VAEIAGPSAKQPAVPEELALLANEQGKFLTTAAARGYWQPDTLAGPVIAGLIGRTLETEFGDPSFNFTRLTIDLFRQAPFEALEVVTTLLRGGNRVRVADATVVCGGVEVARGRGLLLHRSENPPGEFWTPPAWDMPPPDALGPARPAIDSSLWQMKTPGREPVIAQGGASSARRLWLRPARNLIAGEQMTPFTRCALAVDITNPLANSTAGGVAFINADITLYLHRLPAGDWLGIEVASHQSAEGIAIGESTLYDEGGPVGKCVVAAIANRRSSVGPA
jgi:hypothetical protein